MANEKKLETLNLYKRTRAYVHAPNSMGNDAYPLYKRVDMTSVDSDTGEDAKWLASASKDEEWSNKIEDNYGSPRNIRRLFIGVNKYVVHFWEPVISKGKQGDSRITKFTSSKKLEFSQEFIMTGKNDKYNLGSSRMPLTTLKDWSLKNLEEVYFDWTAIYTNNSSSGSTASAICTLYSKVSRDMQMDAIKQIFIKSCCKSDNLDKEYPRLKVVAFVSNLDELIEKIGTSFTGVGKDSLDDMRLNWLDEMTKKYGDDLNSRAIAGFYGVNNNRLYDKFYTSPNIYVFDKILQEKFRRISSEIDKLKQKIAEANKADKKEKKTETVSEEVTNEPTSFEKSLGFYVSTIAKANGGVFENKLEGESRSAFSYIAKILNNECGQQNLLAEMALFSKEGKSIYQKPTVEILGIKKN